MKLTETKLKGVYIVEPQVFGDERGWFMETYSAIKTPEIACDLIKLEYVQTFIIPPILQLNLQNSYP